MTNLPFFKFDTDAWLTGKIQCLEITEKGIFIELIARIWHNGGSIKNDDILHRLLRVEKDTLSDALKAFFEIGIMAEIDGFLRVTFIDSQIKEVANFRSQQAISGAKGGKAKKGYPKADEGYPKANEGYPKADEGYPKANEGYPKANEGYPKADEANREREKERNEKDNISPLPPHGGERATSENFLDDEIFQRLNVCFLNSSSPQKALPAVRDALDESGVTLEYLIDRCETYGRYIRLWPQEERRFSYSLTSFLREGHFREDETIWQREDRKTAGTSGRKHNMENVTQEQLDAAQRIIDGDNAD